jgi:hypothetical protein
MRTPDGTVARLAGPDAEPLREHSPGNLPGEKTPLPFEATPIGASPAIDTRPRRLFARASNPQALWPLCPCAALTGCLHPEVEPLLATHLPLWCFPPFPCSAAERGRREGEVGRRGERRRRAHRRRAAPREPESRPGSRSRSRGSTAAVNIYTEPATTTPPTQCERHHSLLHLFPSLVSALS